MTLLASPPRPQPPQPPRTGARTDLLWRAVVVAAGVGCALLAAPALVTGVLVLAGVLLAAERLAALRRLGRLDVLLLSVGGALVSLVLVGLVLGSTAIGLHPRPWALALGGLSLVALALAAVGPRPSAPRTGRAHGVAVLRAAPWVLAALVVVGFSVTVSQRSVTATSAAPVQMSFGRIDATHVQVLVTASATTGPLEMRTSTAGTELSYPLFTVQPGHTSSVDLTLPTTGRYTISLNRPDQAQPLRTLILDR